jgi:ribonucleotide reductase beta subunit family protein with ferritin-like domain
MEFFGKNKLKKSLKLSIINKMSLEPLLDPSNDRFVIFPIRYTDIWEMFQKQRKAFWSESEIDLVQDIKQWKALNSNEQFFIKRVLAFFAGSDGIVMENLGARFLKEVQIPECRFFYGAQLFIESIHSLMYAQLLDTYVSDLQEKTMLFRSIETIPVIAKKADWALKWISSNDNFATRLVAFAAVEGIFFSGSFCCIYWLKERGLLSGLTKSNDFIARDEGLHCDFAVLLYRNYVQQKLSDEILHEIIQEALSIEKEFIIDSIPCHMIGMNSKLMSDYIDFVANRLVVQLGHSPLFKKAYNPFPFMDRICFDSKDNFFDGRATSYQVCVDKTEEDELDSVSFNANF